MMRGNGNLFSAKVIATNKVYYDDRLLYLNVRTLDGQIGFMAHHAPIVVAVDIGVLGSSLSALKTSKIDTALILREGN